MYTPETLLACRAHHAKSHLVERGVDVLLIEKAIGETHVIAAEGEVQLVRHAGAGIAVNRPMPSSVPLIGMTRVFERLPKSRPVPA